MRVTGEQGQKEVYQRPKVDGDLSWFCLRVLSQKELLARTALTRMGFEVRFAERENWRHANHYTARRRKKFPLFTGYLFVGFRQHQMNIDYMRRATTPHFVGKFLSINGYPFAIPGNWLDALDRGPDAVAKLRQKAMRTHGEYDIEDIVKLLDGPFEGFQGIVQDIDEDEDVATVIVQLFGRFVPVSLPVYQAVKAA